MHIAVVKALEEHAEDLNKINLYARHIDVVQEVYDEWVKEHPDERGHISIGWKANQLNGCLLILNGISNITKEVKPLLAAFAKRGYWVKGTSAYEELGRQTWELYHRDDKARVVVQIGVFFMSESEAVKRGGETCRFVKVGEKTEEVYKLVCPDSPNGKEVMESEEVSHSDDTTIDVGDAGVGGG